MSVGEFKPRNLNAQIVEHIGLKIIRGSYKNGEKIPVEAELCEELGISRPIVREATKILISKGLLTSKPKIGTIVQSKESWNLLDKDVLRWLTQSLSESSFLDMLFDVRRAIEPAAAEIAALKASPAELKAIAAAYNDMANAPTVEETIEPDIRFHQLILNASGNDVLRYIGITLNEAMARSMRMTTKDITTFRATALPPHQSILIAIQNRNSVEAGKAVRYLLDFSRNSFSDEEPVPTRSYLSSLAIERVS